jgi:hypothetical protein
MFLADACVYSQQTAEGKAVSTGLVKLVKRRDALLVAEEQDQIQLFQISVFPTVLFLTFLFLFGLNSSQRPLHFQSENCGGRRFRQK